VLGLTATVRRQEGSARWPGASRCCSSPGQGCAGHPTNR